MIRFRALLGLVLAAVPPLCGRASPLPVVDLSGDVARHTVIAAGTPEIYQGHPTTTLLPDGKTVYAVWTRNHGGPCGPMKRSDDAGRNWSDLLPVPENWGTTRNCPSLYQLADPSGVTRIFVFAGQGPGGRIQPDNGAMHQSHSTDNGRTWTPMAPNGLECVMPFCSITPVESGRKLVGLTNIRRPGDTADPTSNVLARSESTDGGLTWSPWRVILDMDPLKVCEPEVVRSPDGRQLLCLIRENLRGESQWMTSNDEARTWSAPERLPQGLTGDRHKAARTADGRLVVCFRDKSKAFGTFGHFVAWVGTYDDIVSGREGQLRLKLLHNHAGSDCGYPGLESLPDGSFLATTYLKYRPGPDKHSVVCTRILPKDLAVP